MRGKIVAFDIQTINVVYNMPNYDNDGYRALIAGTVDYNDIMRYLCMPGASWKTNVEGNLVNFQAKFVLYEAYSWYLFIASRLMPKSHTSNVTKAKAALLYCIMRNKIVDAGRIIQASIFFAST